MKRFSGCFILLLSFVVWACNTTEEKAIVQKTTNNEKAKQVPTIAVSEFEQPEWKSKDSIAMEYIYLANEYESRGKYKEALVLYKHVCSLEHSLPDVFMNTSFLLYKTGETDSAKFYLHKEIERANYFIRKKHPRSDSFEISIIQSFLFLGEEDSLNFYARKFGHNPRERYEITEFKEMIVQ